VAPLYLGNYKSYMYNDSMVHGHILEEAETSKYLVINLNRTLSLNNHIMEMMNF
jgi:hypothetical protein